MATTSILRRPLVWIGVPVALVAGYLLTTSVLAGSSCPDAESGWEALLHEQSDLRMTWDDGSDECACRQSPMAPGGVVEPFVDMDDARSILDVPGFVTGGGASEVPLQVDLLRKGPYNATQPITLSDRFDELSLPTDDTSPLFGLAIDALSFGQDWLSLDWNDSGHWTLATPPEMPVGDGVVASWAMITFDDGTNHGLYGIAWGDLRVSGEWLPVVKDAEARWESSTPIVPPSPGEGPAKMPLYFFRFQSGESRASFTADYAALDGLDLNIWHATKRSSAATKYFQPIPTEKLKSDIDELKLYFSIDPDDAETMERLEAKLGESADVWGSGATIFSLSALNSGGGWHWAREIAIEFVPSGMAEPSRSDSPAVLGFDSDDDIESLAMDGCGSIGVVSFTADSPTQLANPDARLFGISFLDDLETSGASLFALPSRVDTDKRAPNPIKVDDKLLEEMLRELESLDGEGSISTIDPDGSCGHDPGYFRQ